MVMPDAFEGRRHVSESFVSPWTSGFCSAGDSMLEKGSAGAILWVGKIVDLHASGCIVD